MNRIIRPRLTCALCERFVRAPLPSRPIESGRPGPRLLAQVLVSKYGNNLPLYLRSHNFDREAFGLDRSTLADWVSKTTALREPLAQTTTMTMRISGGLGELVTLKVGRGGAYENISEYVRDLIRQDEERVEKEAFERLKAELTRAFAVPDESFRPLTSAEVIARNRG